MQRDQMGERHSQSLPDNHDAACDRQRAESPPSHAKPPAIGTLWAWFLTDAS